MSIFNFFKKNKCTCKYTIEFPIYAYEENDTSKIIQGTDVFKYLSENKKKDVCDNFEYSNLQAYFGDIGKKILNMKMNFIENGVIHIEVYLKEELSDIDKDKLLAYIKGQLSDGWGEEEISFRKNSIKYELMFWNNENWYIKYIN